MKTAKRNDFYPFTLDDDVALITGGGSGIGLATAQCLHACGATVVLAGRNEKPLKEVVKALGDHASYRVFDVTDFEDAAIKISNM